MEDIHQNTLKKLPVGRHSIEILLKNDYLYVDKTKYIYDLILSGDVYFLSRPRRFGKSLLLSTLEQIFLANKELFKEQWIYESDYNWEKYPVVKLDFSLLESGDVEELKSDLKIALDEIAQSYGVSLDNPTTKSKFRELIKKLYEKTKTPVVILVDEYDKPVINHLANPEKAEVMRDVLREFYTVIKASDPYIKFVLLTGVTKFSKMSVFSGLNNLNDITMDKRFSGLLGITEEELVHYFHEYIHLIADEQNTTEVDIINKIKDWYNGYKFSSEEVKVYNPYSTVLLFHKKEFKNYWFESGTPSFLVNLLKKNRYNLGNITTVDLNERAFESYEIDELDAAPLLFQTGYLTVSSLTQGDDLQTKYKLDFPNNEVKISFTKYLLEDYSKIHTGQSSTFISQIKTALDSRNFEELFNILKSFFANIPYQITLKNEYYFQSIFYSIFTLLGINVTAEVCTNKGRIDAVVETDSSIFLFEFKLHGDAQSALDQIESNEYYQKYVKSSNDKTIYLLGVSFDPNERNINDWKIKTLHN